MARDRGEYYAGQKVQFRISKDADPETLQYVNSLHNFSEEMYLIVRDAARKKELKTLIEEHENKYHK